jgi:hypothetical protein
VRSWRKRGEIGAEVERRRPVTAAQRLQTRLDGISLIKRQAAKVLDRI